MPRVSKNNLLDKQQIQKLEKELYLLLSSFKQEDQLEIFLQDFLSDEERVMLAKRLALYKAIQDDLEYKYISMLLGLSFDTIRIHKIKSFMKSGLFHDTIKKAPKVELKENRKIVEGAVNVAEYMLSVPDSIKKRKLTPTNFDTRPKSK
ncbi:MAG TPA: hypothetical protein VG965_03030 [Patescibacteria group bacterium]|nr:hypothetical protein [Patescibacteria group bacterium]